jgi:Sulfatase
MAKPFRGVINVDVTQSAPDWEPYTQPIAPEGTPNVLYIVLDDVGYSAMGPYGGLIETPNIDRIAGRGLTYTSFHTTAPWPFTGGTIHRAAVDVSGQPFVDLAAEVRMAFMRD